MDEANTNPDEDFGAGAPETPEDVAVLYTWANVHGGKYRDFSASRREFRAQQRHRMVEAQRLAELEAARVKEEAAARELEEARRREFELSNDGSEKAAAEEARRRAEERAEQDRLAAQRHVEMAEELKRAMEQAQREMEEARLRAEEQAARWREADARLRAAQGNAPEPIPGEIQDPYYYAGPLEPTAFAPGKGVRSSVPQRVSSEKRIVETYFRNREGSRGSDPHREPSDDSGFGIFSSGRVDRASSGMRQAYYDRGQRERSTDFKPDEQPSRYTEVLSEPRIETPEDTRERNRPDERERLEEAHGQARFDDNQDDAYYDRMPRSYGADPSHGRNTAAGDLHIPPRSPSPRPSSMSSAERRVITRSEDPQPGNTHLLDHDKPRRRESAADTSARTARRPRFSEQGRPAEGFGERARRIGGSGEMAAYTGPERREQPTGAASETDSRHGEPAQETRTAPRGEARPERPEWLVRNAPLPGEDPLPPRSSASETRNELRSGRREGLTRELPPARESQTVRAPDGGFNLRPLPDHPPVQSPREPARAHDSGARPTRDSATREFRTADLRPLPSREVQVPSDPVPPGRVERRTDSRFDVEAIEVRDERPERRRFERRSGGAFSTPPDDSSIDRRAYDSTESALSRDSSGAMIAAPSAQTPPPLRRAAAEQTESPQNRSSSPQLRPLPDTGRLEQRSRPEQRSASNMQTPAAETLRPSTASRSSAGAGRPAASDTLQQSRERVAARWFALKGLMGPGSDSSAEVPVAGAARGREITVPTLCVVSLSGGVGKTSLVATLGRALSSSGEKVLLADTTAHGLLPYYFGARELRPDVVRTFSPPPGSSDAPVYMVNYATDRLVADEDGQARLVEEIGRHSRGTQRALLDLSASSAWLARRLATQSSHILVPIAPDMNSVLSIQGVERFFSGGHDAGGAAVQPFYVLNQFDASLPLHLDVREVLRQQLGDRLLAVMIRRSPSVAEALAEGMTVIDYAPESPVTEDYIQLAEWVRNLAAPASTSGLRSIRWSER